MEIEGLFQTYLGANYLKLKESTLHESKVTVNSQYGLQSGLTTPVRESKLFDQKLQPNSFDDVLSNNNEIYINTFLLKIFGLLFCRGSSDEKTQILFDTIIGPNGLKLDKDQVSWRNSRMLKAFRYLVYFSDVFPVKYWKNFMEP